MRMKGWGKTVDESLEEAVGFAMMVQKVGKRQKEKLCSKRIRMKKMNNRKRHQAD